MAYNATSKRENCQEVVMDHGCCGDIKILKKKKNFARYYVKIPNNIIFLWKAQDFNRSELIKKKLLNGKDLLW